MTPSDPADRRRRSPWAFAAGSAVLAALFLAAAAAAEVATIRYLVRHGGSLGAFALDPDDADHLRRHEPAAVATALAWAGTAALAFAVAVSALPPRRGWRLRWLAATAAVVGGGLHVAVRWGIQLSRFDVPEGYDFVIALAVAVAIGLAVAVVRQRVR